MKNLQKLVASIAKLWNLQVLRANLYKKAMAMENLGGLRRLFSRGHMSSLLFKKEIHRLYDYTKNSLNDGDIQDSISEKETGDPEFVKNDEMSIATKIRENEHSVIKEYDKVLSKTYLTDEAQHILSDHLDKLKEFGKDLDDKLSDFDANTTADHASAQK